MAIKKEKLASPVSFYAQLLHPQEQLLPEQLSPQVQVALAQPHD